MVSDLKTFTKKGCKIATQKKFIFELVLPYWARFFWYQCFSLRLTVFLPKLPKLQCPNFLDFRNPWEKIFRRSGLRFELLLVKGVKLPRWKKFFTFFIIWSLNLNVFLPPLPEVQCPNYFRFAESLWKNNGKNWSLIWKLFLMV